VSDNTDALWTLMWIEEQLGVPISHLVEVRRTDPHELVHRLIAGAGTLAHRVRSALGPEWPTVCAQARADGHALNEHQCASRGMLMPCMLTRSDPRVPDAVRALHDAPLGIRMVGAPELLTRQPRVAIVGSRRPRADSLAAARSIAAGLARRGITIVSGLAVGVDTAAHRGALDAGGTTLAVLGSGLAEVHPTSNRQLADQIIQQHGGLLSEYPSRAPARPHQFAARNRLIAACADVLVVIQARMRSGSMITARRAEETNTDVGVVPGWISDSEFAGSLSLIRDGATVITNHEDVLRLLGIAPATSAEFHRFGSLLDAPRSVEELAGMLECGVVDVFAELLDLEVAGMVVTTPDGRWMNRCSA
jgi:DNA processing protein